MLRQDKNGGELVYTIYHDVSRKEGRIIYLYCDVYSGNCSSSKKSIIIQNLVLAECNDIY